MAGVHETLHFHFTWSVGNFQNQFRVMRILGKILLPCLFLTASLGMGMAQLAEKATLFGGITYQFVGLTDVTSNTTTAFYSYGLGLGMDFVLAHSNDVVSIGVNPNANLCFQLNSFTGFSFLGAVPVYMLARVGAGATPFNEQRFGIGAGIGGSASYFTTTYGPRAFFMNPGAVVELNLNLRSSSYLFRFNWSLLRPTQELDINRSGTPYPYRIGLTGLSIMSTF